MTVDTRVLPAPTTDLDRAERDLAAHGICCVPDVLDAEQVAAIRLELDAAVEAAEDRPYASAKPVSAVILGPVLRCRCRTRSCLISRPARNCASA